jgi:hypothetical protein
VHCVNSSPGDSLYSCALLAASLIHFELNWPTCTLLVFYSYSTRAALPSFSPIIAEIPYAENAAPYTVARKVTEFTWSFLTVAPSSVTAQPSNARQREARGREGTQDAAALCYCCAIAFLEVSDFYQLPHGAITPQYILLFTYPTLFHRGYIFFSSSRDYVESIHI